MAANTKHRKNHKEKLKGFKQRLMEKSNTRNRLFMEQLNKMYMEQLKNKEQENINNG